MAPTSSVSPIIDPEIIRRLRSARADFIVTIPPVDYPEDDIPLDVDPVLVPKPGWVAIPLPDDFDYRRSSRLAVTALALEYEQLYVISLELRSDNSQYHELDTTGGPPFPDLSYLLFSTHFLVVPPDFSFAVLATHNDYCIVGGSLAFVQGFLGRSIEAAKADFLQWAKDAWDGQDYDRLMAVARRYGAS